MRLEPIDIGRLRGETELPEPWKQLEASGFHEDLLLRAYAHKIWSDRRSLEVGIPTISHNARVFLASIGKGFIHPFKRDSFNPPQNDPHYDLKKRALDAIEELAEFFGDRVSSVTWNSFAHLATRKDPEVKKSILKEAAEVSLPHHYGILDNALHAAGKVYTFLLHVQSVFWKHTGMILVHNCDCNCSLLNLQPIAGTVRFAIEGIQVAEATQSLFTHQCAESHLILNERIPFEYTITGDGIAVFNA